MHASDLKRWMLQRQLGEKRELAEMRDAAPPPAEAFEHGLRMIAFAQRLHGWPLPEDEQSALEDVETHQRWARLRRILSNT